MNQKVRYRANSPQPFLIPSQINPIHYNRSGSYFTLLLRQ
jgi:hypothetical protein